MKNPDGKEWEKIELREEKLDELLGRTPSWIMNWGMVIIFLFVCILFIGSNFFKYPETVKSSITIISENPPVSVVAQNNGKLDYLFVQNGQSVHTGEYLAIVENTANHLHVIELKKEMEKFQKLFLSQDFSKLNDIPNNYTLGSIQISYSNFQRLYNEFKNFILISILEKKIASVKQQLVDYDQYSDRLKLQVINQETSVKLNYKQFKRDSLLLLSGVIAAAEFEKSEQAYLGTKNSYQAIQGALANVRMQMNQLNYQIIDLQSQRSDQTGSMVNSLQESYNNLKFSIAEWEKKYVLISPIDGAVTFNKYWSANQFVMLNDIVFSIIPSKPQRVVGRVKFPIAGSGKVEVKQRVQIKLDNFPYIEFGMVEGRVETISLIPETVQDALFYTAEISLPNGLTTNYKKKLPFYQQMQGSAEIITKDMTIFQRMVNPIRSKLKSSL